MSTKVLLVVYGASDGTEMVRLASELLKRGFQTSLHFVGTWAELAPRLDCSRLDGCHISDVGGPVVVPSRTSEPPAPPTTVVANTSAAPAGPSSPVHRSVRNPVRRVLGDTYYRTRRGLFRLKSVVREFLNFEVIKLRRDLAASRRLLDRERPDVLVLPLEAVGDRSGTLASVARALGIPIVIVPYTIPVNVAEIGERFYYDKKYWVRRPLNFLTARLAPTWVKNYRGRLILRLRPSEIAARKLFGLTYTDPWKAGGLQFADAIAVENAAMKAYYLGEGFPAEKLHVTGTIVDDMLANSTMNRRAFGYQLDQELDLDPGKPVLLCAMPPDFASREECEFGSYQEIVEFWISTLASLGAFNIVVRLHPSLDMKDFAHLAQGKIRFAQRDTAQLVPLCDLYVASVSSTIRWAIACGIPVVNYDLYRFRYADFAGVPGVLLVETPDAFLRILQKLNAEPDYLESVRAAQEGVRRNWGALDGLAGDRIGALIRHLAVVARTEGDVNLRRRRAAC